MTAKGALKREHGVFGATMMGLGAMVGTGVFVSIGVPPGWPGLPVRSIITSPANGAKLPGDAACPT
jgi:hypothetical protein